MKSRPILFSGPMIRALLDGRKTQTRRIVEPQPPSNVKDAGVIVSASESNGIWSWLDSEDLEEASCVGDDFRCPYGAPGDLLWVRETWLPTLAVRAFYRATHEEMLKKDGWAGRWRSPIHMPRKCSRLTLRITEVCIERLQSISCADAIAEGIRPHANSATIDCDTPDPRDDYRDLWISINGARAWAANPWVWALTFAVENRNVDDVLKAAA